MERRKIIAGNWKMHKTIGEAIQFIDSLIPLIPMVRGAKSEIWIAPAFTAIAAAAKKAEGSSVRIGAQNMSDVDEGAFTGEISAKMLKEAGAQFVILGHSERRSHFNETDEHIHHKIKRALSENIPAILCIGESESERESGRTQEILSRQLAIALAGFSPNELSSLIVAYEPVWAIGTGKSATAEMAQETHKAIRFQMEQLTSAQIAASLPILYGGSVKPANIKSLLEMPDIDGALIGGASLDVSSFSEMVLQG